MEPLKTLSIWDELALRGLLDPLRVTNVLPLNFLVMPRLLNHVQRAGLPMRSG